jgi:hypothetical protein
MQHGLISDLNYYSLLKRQKNNQKGWPDHVLCWDQESVMRVNRITKGHTSPIVVGNPSYHSNYGAELHEAGSTDSQQRKRKFSMEILITGTYNNYGAILEDKGYQNVGISTQLINLIKKSPHIFWRIRLHPVLVRFKFDSVSALLRNEFKNCENVDWMHYSKVSLGNAFNRCSGHITVESASALDAAQNSIPTLLIGCPGSSDEEKAIMYFGEYIKSGIMKFIDAPDFSLDQLDFFVDYTPNNYINVNASQNFSKFIEIIRQNISLKVVD